MPNICKYMLILTNIIFILSITSSWNIVQARESEPDAVDCVDTKRFGACEFFKEEGYCSEKTTIERLQRKCDYSCGWCSKSKECVDRAPYINCKALSQEECNLKAAFYVTRCRKSCGWCDDGPKGIWKPWGKWGPCSVTCGSNVGSRTKRRKCLSGACKGDDMKTGFCTASKPCPEWSEWSEWTRCSVTCGNGTRTRNRTCSVEDQCGGSYIQIAKCELPKCVAGAIPFDKWTKCSRTCGGGSRFFIKSCAQWDRDICPRIYQDCNMHECPYKNCVDYRYGSKYFECCDQSAEKQCFRVAKRIFGGSISSPERFPWMARIEKIGGPLGPFARRTICGGTLIHPRYVLTAAHCLEASKPKELRVYLGSISTRGTSTKIQLMHPANFTIHPNFTDPANDVAIITLTREAAMTNVVRPLCLADGEITPLDEHCYVAGWGLTRPGQTAKSSPNLLEARIRNLPFGYCKNVFANRPTHSPHMSNETMICGGEIGGGVDTCRGDSGGPMMCQRCDSCDWYLAGITAFGSYHCGSPRAPGVYMRVTHYEDWINDEIDKYEEYGLDCIYYNSI